jgi:hypothetical protein
MKQIYLHDGYKFLLLMLFYSILYIYITGYFFINNEGYYGYQDVVRYQDYVTKQHYDVTHWYLTAVNTYLDVRITAYILCFVFVPLSLLIYYGNYKQPFEYMLYSPMIIFILQLNAYSQIMFFCLFVIFKRTNNHLYAYLSVIAHPALSCSIKIIIGL